MIRPATEHDLPTIAHLIRSLVEYEKLASEVTFTAGDLGQRLFGPRPSLTFTRG